MALNLTGQKWKGEIISFVLGATFHSQLRETQSGNQEQEGAKPSASYKEDYEIAATGLPRWLSERPISRINTFQRFLPSYQVRGMSIRDFPHGKNPRRKKSVK